MKQLNFLGIPIVVNPAFPRGSFMLIAATSLEAEEWHSVVAYTPDGRIISAKCRMEERDCVAKDVEVTRG